MSFRARSMAIAATMVLTAALAYVIAPRQQVAPGSVALERMIPRHFGEWVEQSAALEQVSPEVGAGTGADRPLYDQILMRTYRRQSDGETIMLTLAYGRRQVQESKIHRPELCYYSQGYDVRFVGRSAVTLRAGLSVESNQLLTRNRSRFEPVTYWIRIGHRISLSAWETRWLIFKEGLSGSIPDGILVRASSVIEADTDSPIAFESQKVFFADLYQALSPAARSAIAGT